MATQKEIAKHLSMSERRIVDVLKKIGLPGKGNTLDEARDAYISYLREVAAGRGSDGEHDLTEERARLSFHQANGQEMKNQVLRKELAPLLLMELAISKWSDQAKSLLGATPLKVKKLLPKMKASEIEIIKREIIKVQNAISKIQLDWEGLPDNK